MRSDVEPIAFLAESETRVRLLAALCERSALSRTELREHLEAARTTVTRNLTALAERGWVCESAGRYAVTPFRPTDRRRVRRRMRGRRGG